MTGRPWRAQTVGPVPAADADTAAEVRTELPANLSSARRARAAVREALASWGMDDLAADAELLASEQQLAHLRQCCGDNCGWLFLDSSKNHSRRWCDMRDCGNRAKVRRHRQKHPPASGHSHNR